MGTGVGRVIVAGKVGSTVVGIAVPDDTVGVASKVGCAVKVAAGTVTL